MIIFPIVELTLPVFNSDICSRQRCRKQPKNAEAMPELKILHELFGEFFNLPAFQEKKSASQDNKKDGQLEKAKDVWSIPVKTEGYQPDEITIKIKERVLSVHGKHEEKNDGSFVSHEFRREFTIPSEVDPEAIVAEMDRDGLLSVKAISRIPGETQIESKENLQENDVKDAVSEHEKIDSVEEVAEHEIQDQENLVSVKKESFVKVETDGFKPEEVAVKIKDGNVIVQAKHEEKESGSFVYRELRREFPIPPEVDPLLIVAEINEDGLLCIRESSDIPEKQKIPNGDEKSVSVEEREVKVNISVPVQENDLQTVNHENIDK